LGFPQRLLFNLLEHEIQRLVFGELLQALLAKLLFAGLFLGADKRPGQDDGIFDQVGDIEHQGTAPGFAVHDRKAVRDTQHPQRGGGQAIGQVVAVIQKAVGKIGGLMVAGKLALLGGFGLF